MASEGAAFSMGYESAAVAEQAGQRSKMKLTVNVYKGEILGQAVHSQVMKIREEDQHLGEDWREGVSPRERIAILHLTSQMKDVFFSCSRPAFPSPLGMKAGVRSA